MIAKTISLRALVIAFVSCLAAVTTAGFDVRAADPRAADPLDWPHWRGPELNGISREKGLVDSWSPDGENLLWKNDKLGGRSTPIIMNGKLYTIVRDQPGTLFEREKVVCADATTGDILWENAFNVYLSDVPDTRVGWSSVAGDPETGKVYALGVCGYFQCIDGDTGKTIWSHSMCEEYGLLSTYGGRTNFPIVFDSNVIISAIVIGWGEMAKPAHRFIAFDKRNGQPVWFEQTRLLPYDTTYSSPILATIDGQKALIFGSGDGGVHAFQPRTGRNIWTYNVSRRGLNGTPLFYNNMVFSGHSEENLDVTAMGAFFAIDATKKGDITENGELWRHTEWFVGKSSPIVVDDRIYAIEDKGKLLIIEPKTGYLITRKALGRSMLSSPLYADGKIYCCTASGIWYILRPTDDGVEIIHRLRLTGENSLGSPIVSHGRIYFPTTEAIYCIGKADHKPTSDPRPKAATETPIDEDTTAAHAQLVPVESLLRPSAKSSSGTERFQVQQDFQVRLYNANGQFLRMANPVKVTYSIESTGGEAGSIDTNGVYTAPMTQEHRAVTVTAKVGELTGTARIRVVPNFPWNFDFDDGEIPVTWVGARYRHVAVDFDLFTSLTAQNPLAGQLYIILMPDFINGGRNELVYNDGTPRQLWSRLMRFLGLLESLKTLNDAKQAIQSALELLVKEKVLEKYEWSEPEDVGKQLTVTRGPRKVDGNGVMLKITTIPLGARSQGWMGHADFHDFTIQADVWGAEKNRTLPDMGLIGQRYRLQMMGASQELKLVSWVSHEQQFHTVPFAWKPNVWYTLKLKTSVEERDGKKVAVLRGKAWPRAEQEPSDWQITWTDEPSNTVGSPGLFGNAKVAEIFYDNLKVTAN